MTLDPPITHTLSLLDAALRTLGGHQLADEQVFALDREVSQPYYQRFVLANPTPMHLAVWFEVATAGTSFYIDRSAELPAWSYAWIQENPSTFQAEICVLFSSHILVEHSGNRTVLRLFGTQGVQLRQFTFTQGLALNFFRKHHFTLYPPLIS
ncbi:hypothetical protein GO988_23355 [Hymenobacter sp. HMF4947]|uniref:Uncharacterized protein n=1 Tax=Hymenobacter ginkgonis TaxID=2682976 RepID=A0A7K1TMC8_9BACT|nr:hypothetical protein [Hymenobacter ginkgonis]MVN79281.1 hypothetical protein [Hymenobacter ginkgonis]